MPPSRQPVARAPTKPPPSITNDLVLKTSRYYGTTLRAIFRSTTSSNLWYAETEKPDDNSAPDPNPYTWDTPPRLINLSNARPLYTKATMTSAKYAKKDGLYSKTMNYLRYSTELFGKPYWLKDVVLREIENCEMLRKYPHQNICRYQGVNYEMKSQGITALLFQRYDMTLNDLVVGRHTFDAEKCMHDIRKGIQHIHSLGFVHCDIKPENIFVDIKARPTRFVVGDFDSMQEQGAQLKYKCGTSGWTPEKADNEDWKVDAGQDWFGLEMVGAWIREKGDGSPVEGRVYPKTSEILKRARRKIEMGERAKEVAEEVKKAETKKRAQAAKRIDALEKAEAAKKAEAKKKAEAVEKAEAAKKTEVAKKAKSINKADALKKIEAAKKASPPKPQVQQKPATPKKATVVKPTQFKKNPQAAKRLPSPKRKPGAPKKLRIGPP